VKSPVPDTVGRGKTNSISQGLHCDFTSLDTREGNTRYRDLSQCVRNVTSGP